ncbi:MAG: acetylornithine deacetylase/succinyl-diaminopimelate desuccinylase-like protein [Candidatus Poriferisodalaceae bacterium]|jgi:acetylornithine deacetylase/succinyl-diaminopimelate desuccinylase-like protein
MTDARSTDISYTDPTLTNETVELLQVMIRNECVNNGRRESGEEIRNSDLLETFLEGPGVDIEHFDCLPGRRSMVARIEGTDPDAPALCLMGHTDVVPVSPEGWSQDPFGGELIDGEVWGRGAVDMLNLTSSMAVAFRHIARTGVRPKGDLVYFGVADEEAGGTYGAKWMAEHHWDAMAADYVLTEFGGLPTDTPDGKKLTLAAGEKGLGWRRLTVKGTPGHGSMPFGADNALIKAAEVVRRLAEYRPAAKLTEMWQHQVSTLTVADDVKTALLDPESVWDAIAGLDSPALARHLHACSHTTFSPNVMHGGVKTNVIPDTVEIDVDIRTAPGDSDNVDNHLRDALGELFDEVEVKAIHDDPATFSRTDTPMWHLLQELSQKAHPGAPLIPSLIVGATDARFYRDKGAIAYGAGLFSNNVSSGDFMSRFHGHDERIDVDSLALTTHLWLDVVDNFWDKVAR